MRYPEQLTKEEAIKRHRQLWTYIADESEKTGKPVSKKQAFTYFGWSLWAKSLCWCCECCGYHCHLCPIEWPGNDGCIWNPASPYHKLRVAENLYFAYASDAYRNPQKAEECLKDYIKYAREIANLPERKD